jgi:hypothetical protein
MPRGFAIQATSWIEPVLYHIVRGVVKVKPEGGTLHLSSEALPNAGTPMPNTVVFVRVNKPFAIAKLKPQVTFNRPAQAHEVEYYEVRWLTDKAPKET